MRVVETRILDANTGEIVSERTTYGNNNGSGWVIHYLKLSEVLARRCDSAVTFRVLHLLISRLNSYSSDEGIVCSRKWIQDSLNVSRKSVYNALQWLAANDIFVESVNDGCTEFFPNPEFITIGKNKRAREKRYKAIKSENYIRSQCLEHGLPYPLPNCLSLDDALELLDMCAVNEALSEEKLIELYVENKEALSANCRAKGNNSST